MNVIVNSIEKRSTSKAPRLRPPNVALRLNSFLSEAANSVPPNMALVRSPQNHVSTMQSHLEARVTACPSRQWGIGGLVPPRGSSQPPRGSHLGDECKASGPARRREKGTGRGVRLFWRTGRSDECGEAKRMNELLRRDGGTTKMPREGRPKVDSPLDASPRRK